MSKEETIAPVTNQEKGALISASPDEKKDVNLPLQAPKNPPPSNLELFLKELDEIGKKYGYGLAGVIEPYLQDNGAYSFKARITPIELPKTPERK